MQLFAVGNSRSGLKANKRIFYQYSFRSWLNNRNFQENYLQTALRNR